MTIDWTAVAAWACVAAGLAFAALRADWTGVAILALLLLAGHNAYKSGKEGQDAANVAADVSALRETATQQVSDLKAVALGAESKAAASLEATARLKGAMDDVISRLDAIQRPTPKPRL